MNETFLYDGPRFGKSIVKLAVLLICPFLFAQYSAHSDFIFVFFGIASSVWLFAVLLTVFRFRLTLTEDALVCRGRFATRTVRYSEIQRVILRKRSDRSGRADDAQPETDIVMETDGKRLVISSIPLGRSGTQRVIEILRQRIAPKLWSGLES